MPEPKHSALSWVPSFGVPGVRGGRIDVPVQIVLTEHAVGRMLAQNKRLGRQRLQDGAEGYGFATESMGPAAVQSMIADGYISRIQFSQVALLDHRPAVVDLTKAIVFGILYALFARESRRVLLESDVVKRWNRAKPTQTIDENTKIKDEAVRRYLVTHRQQLVVLHQGISAPVVRELVGQVSDKGDKEVLAHLSNRYLRAVPMSAWYLMLTLFSAAEREDLINELRALLKRYLDKSDLAEYLALIVVELMVHAEYAGLLRQANRKQGDAVTVQQLVTNEVLRKQIQEELERRDERISLIWNLSAGVTGEDRRARLAVSLLNRGWRFNNVRDEVNTKLSTRKNERALDAYFLQAATTGFDTTLGMHYLSYLDEACKRFDIHFDSTVSRTAGDSTMINLILQFLK